MTFSETIDALVKLYSKGMRAKKYTEIIKLRIDDGMCITADLYDLNNIYTSRKFKKYKPKNTDLYWFPAPYCMKFERAPFAKIKEKAIKPRLELLKRIQKDLKEKK